jgi:hypothetical protein
MSSTFRRAKRRLHPLVPRALVVRYRSTRHLARTLMGTPSLSTRSRSNIDIVVPQSEAKRWMKLTPPTHRVVEPSSVSDEQADVITFGDTRSIEGMSAAIMWQGTAAVIAADVDPPSRPTLDKGLDMVATGLILALDVAPELRIIESEEIDAHTVFQRLANTRSSFSRRSRCTTSEAGVVAPRSHSN